MTRIRKVREGMNVAPLWWALAEHPELWNQTPDRTTPPASPHFGLSDIYIRYGENPLDRENHESVWYPAAAVLPVRDLIFELMAILGQVTQQYPDFDATQYGARQQAAKSFGTGALGLSAQSANTALTHLDTIQQLALAQKNGDFPLFNRLANEISAQTGSPAPTNLKAAIGMVAPELTKAVVGTGGGVAERADFAHNLNPNGSPEQILGGVGVIQDLLGGRLSEVGRTYQRTTGRSDFADTFLSPAATKVFNAKKNATAGGAQAPGLPAISDVQAELARRGVK